MKLSSGLVDGRKMALEHVAQYVRPLLGEAGERLAQTVGTQKRDAVMRGFVGLAFVETDYHAILFAQTINQDAEKQKQNWPDADVYRYSRLVPFVKAVTQHFSQRVKFVRQTYSLSGSDFHYKGIHAPLTEAFKRDLTRRVTFALFRRKISEKVVLYCALPKGLLNDAHIRQTLHTGFDSARSFFLLNLLNAFFLAEATLPDNRDLDDLLSLLRDKLGLQPGFFDRFLQAQGAALDDLHAPSTWLTSPYNSVTLPKPALQPPDAEYSWMADIRGASNITLVRPLSGSLQGKPVYLVTVEPRTHENYSAGERYPAVVKKASLDSVVKEHRGYLKVQQYFDEIRDVIPPLSVAWKLSERKGSDNYVVVTPRVSGDTLRAFIRDRWDSPWALAGQRVATFRRLLERLLRFTEVIGSASVWTDEKKAIHQPMLDSHLGESEEAKRRERKTREALAFFLDSYQEKETLIVGETTVVNPLWLFDRRKSIQWVERENRGLIRSSCRHGDFHAGNILVTEQGGVTVLDFDYVDKGYRFDDEATLEVSFLLSVANADKFRVHDTWQKVFPGLLKSLVAQTDNVTPDASVLQDPDAFEIWTLIQTVRREVTQRRYFHVYGSLLGTALFRLITSFRRELVDPHQYHPGVFSTALLYLGLIFDNLVKRERRQQTTAPVIDLFPRKENTDPLMSGNKLDLNRAYLQSVFRWQAGLAKPKPRRGAEGFIELRDEHLKELQQIVENKRSVIQQASVYRFGLRLKRIAQSNAPGIRLTQGNDWAPLLAKIYSDKAGRSDGESKQAFQNWASRYERTDANKAEVERKQIHDARVYQGLNVAPVEKSVAGWSICGLSDYGKQDEPRKNDDAFAILNIGGTLVAAVADGTGDSLDGERASKLALSSMRKELGRETDLAMAIFQASKWVQADNCAERLDGACCLVAVRAKANGDVVLANVGDTRFVPVGANQGAFPAKINKAKRWVLGGEPIGDIITSGGNLVRELQSSGNVGIRHYKAVQRFALMTDGAFVSDNEEDIAEIKAILRKSTSPKEAATAILKRALDAFKSGKDPDNVTVVVGWRKVI